MQLCYTRGCENPMRNWSREHDRRMFKYHRNDCSSSSAVRDYVSPKLYELTVSSGDNALDQPQVGVNLELTSFERHTCYGLSPVVCDRLTPLVTSHRQHSPAVQTIDYVRACSFDPRLHATNSWFPLNITLR